MHPSDTSCPAKPELMIRCCTFQRKWATMANPSEEDALVAVLTFIYNRYNAKHPEEKLERLVDHRCYTRKPWKSLI